MSNRSTGAALTAASAQHSPAAGSASGNRSSPGGAIQSTPVSQSAGSTAARSGGSETNDTASGGGEFQRLLTHVNASAQGKEGKAPASQADASGAKKHDRSSDSKKSQPTASPDSPQAPGQGVLAPIAAVPVPSGRSAAGRSQGTRTDTRSAAGPTAVAKPSLKAATGSKDVTDSSAAAAAKTDSKSDTGPAANLEARTPSNAKLDDSRSRPMVPQPGAGNSKAAGALQRAPSGPGTSQGAGHGSKARPDAASAAGAASAASPDVASLADTRSLSHATAAANAATGAQSPTDATTSSAARTAGARSASAHRTHDGRELPAQMPVAQTSNASMHATLNAPVGAAPWSDQLGNQLIWMAHHKVDTATLHVSPAGLGPIEARIALHGGAASVWFGASHPDTRAALEQALPRLRAMFAMQGLSLTDTGVSRDAPRRQPQAATASVTTLSGIKPLAQSAPASETSAADRGLVDLYA